MTKEIKCPKCRINLEKSNHIFTCKNCDFIFEDSPDRIELDKRDLKTVKQMFVEEYIDLVRKYHLYLMKWGIYDDWYLEEISKKSGKFDNGSNAFFLAQIGELMKDSELTKKRLLGHDDVMKKIWPGDKENVEEK